MGLHFFNPVAQMMLVEIVEGPQTSAAVMQAGQAFARQIDKLPLPCKSAPGFLVNRVLSPYLLEAMLMVDEGIPAETLDAAAKDFGMPMGPIELADMVGLDIAGPWARSSRNPARRSRSSCRRTSRRSNSARRPARASTRG